MRTTVSIEEFESKLNLLIGKPVWAARYCSGTTILIDLGDKVLRRKTYGIPALSEGERRYQGELTLMISCAWRVELEGAGIVSGSGDLEDEVMVSGLTKLVGQTVAEVSANSFLDLLVVFTGGLRLRLFCDMRADDLDYDYYYVLFVRAEGAYSVANGAITTLERDAEAGFRPSTEP
jgi:hypothetical protein